MKRNLILPSILLMASAAVAQTNLKVDRMTSPIGIDNPSPLLSWQSACNNMVSCKVSVSADSTQLDSWEKAPIRRSFHGVIMQNWEIPGGSLKPFTTYYWRVWATDAGGTTTASKIARFETGMMDTGNWQGSWISDGESRDCWAAPYFRKVFNIKKPVKEARAYVSAGGLFVFSLNGKRVGDHFLDPVFTRYDKRLKYVTFDITPYLKEGNNAAGIVLGNGWYNHQAMAVWDYERAPWRQRPTFCADIRVTYTDGTVETIFTDLSWRTSKDGPLVYNNIYTGEHYDFRKTIDGWDTPQYDDSKWGGVRLRQAPANVISAQAMEPIRMVEDIPAADMKKVNDTTLVYDFGKNMAGITTVRVKGPEGSVVRIAHGERLHPDGSLDPSNIDVYYRGDKSREPFQTDVLTLDGKDDTFRAEFSYKGFRYVQVTAQNLKDLNLDRQSLTAHFIHSDVATVGSIKSSNPLLEKMVAAARQAYISNLVGYPTDCPQREKNGWTGDGHLAIETAFFNFDGYTIYEKWMADHRDEQQPNGVLPDIIPTCGWGYGTDNGLDWTSTVAIIPWNMYLFYGDIRPLRDNYENIKRYVDYVDRNSPNHLTTWGRGDWVPVKSRSDKELTSSVYFYNDVRILMKAAKLLDKNDDYNKYHALYHEIGKAINNKFLNKETGIYASGTQTEQAVPLAWGVPSKDNLAKVALALAKRVKADGSHIDCGVLGTRALFDALTTHGYGELAYDVATQDTYPSWGWWVVNGATSLLENWDLKATRDISDNHIMFGEIGAWPYKALGGIFPDEKLPGFKHTFLTPTFIKKLESFEARHTSPYGEIVSAWKWNKSRTKVEYTVTVPANTTATLIVHRTNQDCKTELQAGVHKFVYKASELKARNLPDTDRLIKIMENK